MCHKLVLMIQAELPSKPCERRHLHCKNLVGLSIAFAQIDGEIASTIVSKLATIKCLALNNAILEKEHLKVILLGCKELELLYVRNCVGFDEDDEEIIKLASRIKDFRCQGSTLYEFEDDGHISHDELVYGDCNSD
ncbi:hypothetical protein POM88_003805 [Heracleum sosnowskyi]|uniref:Uncharacterized protein n=1 Tax=Heracleum sosnowskyi TaxID=360622 RepID=A0AAD8JLJ8_9APIA|nr:hypothetical protein POM88_003805 [Heracleum sosnowskyi]